MHDQQDVTTWVRSVHSVVKLETNGALKLALNYKLKKQRDLDVSLPNWGGPSIAGTLKILVTRMENYRGEKVFAVQFFRSVCKA